MIETRVDVEHAVGLHARPAAQVVQQAQKYSSKITLWTDGKSADAKSLLSILALGIRQGTQVRICVEGPDDQAALDQLALLVAGRTQEEQ